MTNKFGVTVNCLIFFCSFLNLFCYCSSHLLLYWIQWPYFVSFLNTYSYSPTRLLLQCIVCLLFSFVLNTYCNWSTHLVLQWIKHLLFSSVLKLTATIQLVCCYSEFCDSYSVHFSIRTAFAQLIWCYSDYVIFIHFTSQFILFLLNSFVVTL